MERTLALICGAGGLPALMAEDAGRQGWRVVAFRFGGETGPVAGAVRTMPCRVTEIEPVLRALADERASAAVLAGTFRIGDVLRPDAGPAGDAYGSALGGTASLREGRLFDLVLATLAGLDIEVLDQRVFLGAWLGGRGRLGAHEPSAAAWSDVRHGLACARLAADAGIGQTVVVKRGVVTAVEAAEGTTEAIRRGALLAGPGAAIVKAVARAHDYRFDTPAIGPETIAAAAAGRAAVVAVEAGRVLVVERQTVVRQSDAAGLAVVGIDAEPA